ncbi:MAG: glycosyl hydrolase family 18 protein [Oscillospiraceae bacterium]|nr:glycosyl hydrolase family 18 protein [Oscillospiraceae bacterium]
MKREYIFTLLIAALFITAAFFMLGNKVEPRPPQTTRVTQSPKTTRASQSPKTTKATQSPKTTKVSQTPKITKATQSPKTTKASQTPKTTKATQSPKTTKASQTPKATKATQPPQTTSPPQTSAVTPRKSVQNSGGFKVVAYFPYWRAGQLDKLDFSVITHVNYAFAIPTTDGKILPLENPTLARNVISRAHNGGAKALISVGGWSYNNQRLSTVFEKATESEQKAQAFAKNIAALCDNYGFDGVDIDWEYPTLNSAGLERLMRNLHSEMAARGKLLTVAVPSGVSADGRYVYESAKAFCDKTLMYADWLNVMAYDNTSDSAGHASYNLAVNSNNYWKNSRGLSKNKVVMGIPFYSRVYGKDFVHGFSYDLVTAANRDNYNKDTATYNGMTVNYNGYSTVQNKTAFALENSGGVMIWEIAHDSSNKEISLLSAIKNMINKS